MGDEASCCEAYDCVGACMDVTQVEWLGDSWCDDGTYGINLMCDEWSYDNGDCGCMVTDCVGFCADTYASWVGDSFCDDGTYGIDFTCDEWSYDNGDCGDDIFMIDDGCDLDPNTYYFTNTQVLYNSDVDLDGLQINIEGTSF